LITGVQTTRNLHFKPETWFTRFLFLKNSLHNYLLLLLLLLFTSRIYSQPDSYAHSHTAFALLLESSVVCLKCVVCDHGFGSFVYRFFGKKRISFFLFLGKNIWRKAFVWKFGD